MEDKNLSLKVEIPESLDKATGNLLNKPSATLGQIVSTALEYWYNTAMLPMQRYNMAARAELDKYAKELDDKIKNIPEDRRTESSVNILGPAIDGLKYNLNEEHIKELFTNIIVSDMDITTKNKVLPSYIEIVKQLSKDDALFLKELGEAKKDSFWVIDFRLAAEESGYQKLSQYYCTEKNGQKIAQKLNPIIVDNLKRLNLIDFNFGESFVDSKNYDFLFEEAQKDYAIEETMKFKKGDGVFRITEYGMNFLKICIK